MPRSKPVQFVQDATYTASPTRKPEPLHLVGGVPTTALPAGTTAAVGTSNAALATNAFVQAATKSKTQTVALTPLATGGTSTVAQIETAVNAIIAALKA